MRFTVRRGRGKTAGLSLPWGTPGVMAVAAAGGLLLGVMSTCGCRQSSQPSTDQGAERRQATREWKEELFEYAINNIGRLEEFNSGEMLTQIIERLNQWASTQQPPDDWEPDALCGTLPESLAPLVATERLESMEFPPSDALLLRSAVWFRDASNWARGDSLDDLQRAQALFDWTIRNVQLGEAVERPPGQPGRIRQVGWEALLMGRGVAEERAWVFVDLLRQQNIDAVVLAVPVGEARKPEAAEAGEADGEASADARFAPWVVGVLHEEQLYLFDPALGLPVPAADGVVVDEDGELTVRPATLAEVLDDPSLLEQLNVDDETTYPVDAEDLAGGVEALVVAQPASLSRRMALVQSKLVGEQRMVLACSPARIAARLENLDGIAGVRLWERPFATKSQLGQLTRQQVQRKLAMLTPFRTGAQMPLWKGRILHIKGRLSGADGATHFYQLARPADAQLAASDLPTVQKVVYQRAKQHASYWLGLVSYAIENDRSAVDYFATRTLEASPGGPWTPGAQYNLGRTYQRQGEIRKAIEQYRQFSGATAMRMGLQLRAKWLAETFPEVAADEQSSEQKPEAPESEPEEPKNKKQEAEKAKPGGGPMEDPESEIPKPDEAQPEEPPAEKPKADPPQGQQPEPKKPEAGEADMKKPTRAEPSGADRSKKSADATQPSSSSGGPSEAPSATGEPDAATSGDAAGRAFEGAEAKRPDRGP